MAAFAETCGYARRAGLLVIADGKRGDIGSTARAYAAAYLEGDEPLADALTVNPYLGRESIEPYLAAARRQGAGHLLRRQDLERRAVTCRTSTLSDGRPLWQHVAALVADWGAEIIGEHGLSAVGAVVGATHPRAVGEARRLMPQTVLLLPGVGAQGAEPGRPGPCVHERARERPRQRRALGRTTRSARPASDYRERSRGRGGAAARRDLGGVGVVAVPARSWRPYARPARFPRRGHAGGVGIRASLAAARAAAARQSAPPPREVRATPRTTTASVPATRSRRSPPATRTLGRAAAPAEPEGAADCALHRAADPPAMKHARRAASSSLRRAVRPRPRRRPRPPAVDAPAWVVENDAGRGARRRSTRTHVERSRRSPS